MNSLRKVTITLPEDPPAEFHHAYQISIEYATQTTTLTFDDPHKATLFIGHLIGGHPDGAPQTLEPSAPEKPAPAVTSKKGSKHLTQQEFLRQVADIIWSEQPDSSKRKGVLTLYRPLVSKTVLHALSQLPTEVLIARIKADVPRDSGDLQTVV